MSESETRVALRNGCSGIPCASIALHPGFATATELGSTLHAAIRERVGAIVAGIAVVALHPMPPDPVPGRQTSSSRQRSAFLTGFLSLVFQPFFFQPWIQLSMPFLTYWESV